jgi:hypothetical protein
MTSSSAEGTAYDADVETDIGVDDPLRRLQLADLDARELVERLTAKVAKLEAHLDGAREALATAEVEAEQAAAELDAFPGTVG